MKIRARQSVLGKITVIKGRGDRETYRQQFENVVLDAGLSEYMSRICSVVNGVTPAGQPHEVFNYLYLGTGTTQPARSDTGLEARSGTLPGKRHADEDDGFESTASRRPYSTSRQGPQAPGDPYRLSFVYRFAYEEGEAEGVWTELGMGDSNYQHPFSRALFRDESGTPISITVLSDEYLLVFYEVSFLFHDPFQSGTLQTVSGDVNYHFFLASENSDSDSAPSVQQVMVGGTSPLDLKPVIFYQLPAGGVDYTSENVPVVTESVHYSLYYVNGIPFSGNFAFANNVLSVTIVIDPTDNDVNFNLMPLWGDNRSFQSGFSWPIFYMSFPDGYAKPADYRVTFSIDIDFGEPA